MITTNPPCGATILMGINKNGTARGALLPLSLTKVNLLRDSDALRRH